MSDEALAALARESLSGDATVELLRRVSPFISAKARAFGKTEQDRQDYYQEGVLGFLGAVFAYREDGGASFVTYACVCAHNRMKNFLKMHGKNGGCDLSLSDTAEPETDYTCNPEELLQAAVEAENILTAISQNLSRYEKQVIHLHLCGESYQSIAIKTGKSVKSVDNCLQRIRCKLNTARDD